MIVYHGSNFLFLIHPFFFSKNNSSKIWKHQENKCIFAMQKNKHATHTVTYRSDELVKSQV